MRAVLYTDDMEPITVVSLPAFAWDYLVERGVVSIAVHAPIPVWPVYDEKVPEKITYSIVNIRAEDMIRKGRRHMLLFTNDEESALLLRAAFLPGQQATINEVRQMEFARGFLDALKAIGGPH